MVELQRILVPLDGSALSERALPYATALAQKFGCTVILLRVLDIPQPVPGTNYPENHWIREAQQFGHREAQEYLGKQQADLAREGVSAQILVRDMSPAEDILGVAHSEEVDLIVISSHGKGGPSPWTSGSVADKVMQHSPCPVLVIRQNQAQLQT